jgi:hypothetical protein
MISANIEIITPQMASALLADNFDNRKISSVLVNSYASDMLAGRWHLTGQAIIIANDGSLNDGQHRLMAIVKAGIPVKNLVVRGVERETRVAVDTGKPRYTGEILQMFHLKNGNLCSTIANMVLQYERTGGKNASLSYISTKQQIIERATSDELIHLCASFASAKSWNASPSHIGFCRYVIPMIPLSDVFFERLKDGVGLEPGDPILALRNWQFRQPNPRRNTNSPEAILRAWVAYKEGRQMTRIAIMGNLPDGVGAA